MKWTQPGPRTQSQHMWTVLETACEPEGYLLIILSFPAFNLNLRRDCGEMGKSKKIDNPDTKEEANEVLANEVDADQINCEKQTGASHQLSVS